MRFDLHNSEETLVVRLYLEEKQKTGAIVGLTSGCFDLIHFQHAYYFERCRRHCDILIVGVDSDEMVRAEKGPNRPFIFDFKRMIMVDKMKDVSFAFVMNGLPDLVKAARLFQPNFLFRNSDFAGRENEVVGIGAGHADKLIIIHDVEDHSSTTAISRAVAARVMPQT